MVDLAKVYMFSGKQKKSKGIHCLQLSKKKSLSGTLLDK
jgi:hypothetical protein